MAGDQGARVVDKGAAGAEVIPGASGGGGGQNGGEFCEEGYGYPGV
jgi:hypothetical protein